MMASMESLTDCRRGSTALLIRACTPWMKQEGNKQWEGLKWSSAGNVNAKQTQRADHMNFTAQYLCLRDTLLPHSNNLWSQVIEYIYSAVKKSLPQLYTRYFSLFYIVIKIMSVYFSPRTNQTRRHMQLPGHFEKGWNVFVVVLQITYPFNSCLTAILGLSDSSFFSKSNLVSKHREKLMLQKYKNEVLHT